MNKIIESNRDRFKWLSNCKKLSNEELLKRLVTLYLPDHEISLNCIRLVLSNCMLITFNDKLCLLFRGWQNYRVRADTGVTLFKYKEICLLRLPKFIKGQIVFKCFFPLCKAQICITNNHISELRCSEIVPSNLMHSCCHDSRLRNYPKLLLHAT